ncbi:MAG: hypothetical protein R3Y65_01250 [Bacillota bacterium]
MRSVGMKILIVFMLIFCLAFSGCSNIDVPDDMEEFFDVEETTAPTQTASPTSDPIEDSIDFGVVDTTSTEDLLRVYYGLTFPESGTFDAQFEMGRSEYEFSAVNFGVTSETGTTLSDGKVTVSASVSGYDPIGNKISTGITSNMSTSVRLANFGSSSFIQGTALTYPGTYYVTYTITATQSSESYFETAFDAVSESYAISRIYVIDKVDAYIESASDFYFVQTNGADVRASAEITITTAGGLDIASEVTDDIYSTSRISLSVPKITVETDMANAYELDIVGEKGGDEVDDAEIISKYFDLHITNGYRYIIPAEDEVNVKAVYQTLAGLGIDRYNDSYDYSNWDGYLSAVESYQSLSLTEAKLFDLYPTYLLKYDNAFTYNDYYDMRACHDLLYFLLVDCNRVELGENLATLISQLESTNSIDSLESVAEFVTGLSGDYVYITDLIYLAEEYDSDLAFAVKYAFDGVFENGENGYIDIEDTGDGWAICDTTTLVNLAVFANQYKFEMYASASEVLAEISRGEANYALFAGVDFYEKYVQFESVLGYDQYASEVLAIIQEYITFSFDDVYEEYVAVATEKLENGDIDFAETDRIFAVVRECLYESFAGLCDFQKTASITADYAVSVSLCESFMLRFDAISEVLESGESYFENGEFETASGCVLIYNSESGVLNIAGEDNIARMLQTCAIMNLDSLKELAIANITA